MSTNAQTSTTTVSDYSGIGIPEVSSLFVLPIGYEKRAHLYDLFDTKENKEFFFGYASEAGEGNKRPLTCILVQTGDIGNTCSET